MHKPLLLLIAACGLFAQEATIRVNVQQVLVPVVVTDKKGHHVSGLKASDFHISEDGVQQEIAAFSSDKVGSVDDMVALAKPGAASPGPRHTFVICIDTLHASPANAARTRQALENLFETEKPAGAQYVLIGIGRQLQVLQPATTNPLEILVKIRSAAWQSAMAGMDSATLATEVQDIRRRINDLCKRCACGTRSAQRDCDSEVDTLKQAVDGEAERWTKPLQELGGEFKSVVEELAKLPTGRTLILVSDGFYLDPKRELYLAAAASLPDRPQFKLEDVVHSEPMEAALKVAAERNVTIYTVDSRSNGGSALNSGAGMSDATSSGMGQGGSIDMLGTNRPARGSGAVGPMQSAANAPGAPLRLEESASMKELAQSSGGMYFHDSSEMLKQLRSALADGREYYVLAYTPKNSARDGKYRTITVETTDKKLTLRSKPGYWADGAAQ